LRCIIIYYTSQRTARDDTRNDGVATIGICNPLNRQRSCDEMTCGRRPHDDTRKRWDYRPTWRDILDNCRAAWPSAMTRVCGPAVQPYYYTIIFYSYVNTLRARSDPLLLLRPTPPSTGPQIWHYLRARATRVSSQAFTVCALKLFHSTNDGWSARPAATTIVAA